jgi:hypothetical protein
MTPPGFVVRGIRRAFRANPGRELSTRKLWSWTRKNISRAFPRRRRADVRPGWSALA